MKSMMDFPVMPDSPHFASWKVRIDALIEFARQCSSVSRARSPSARALRSEQLPPPLQQELRLRPLLLRLRALPRSRHMFPKFLWDLLCPLPSVVMLGTSSTTSALRTGALRSSAVVIINEGASMKSSLTSPA